jgi:riboflavin kinase / FMN adenylyltransferase
MALRAPVGVQLGPQKQPYGVSQAEFSPMALPPVLSPGFTVLRGGGPVPASMREAVAAIGNFDGVHRGHRAAIDLARQRAGKQGRKALALTFEPHPRTFFKPDEPVFRLSPEPLKLRLFADAGLDGAVVMSFNAALAGLTAEEFVTRFLVQWLGLSGVVVGEDFRFGKGRGGSADLLRAMGAKAGFTIDALPQVMSGGKPISSGAVRAALAEGNLGEATTLLGRTWFVEGEVVKGAARGRELGFPTANMVLDPAATLRHGIYAVRAHTGSRAYAAVASFGRRPQFDNGSPLLEVMLFDFEGDLYGKTLAVEFVDFIRPEAKFDSVDALRAQMAKDVQAARDMLSRA